MAPIQKIVGPLQCPLVEAEIASPVRCRERRLCECVSKILSVIQIAVHCASAYAICWLPQRAKFTSFQLAGEVSNNNS
jgi:hypothetical protein